MKPLRDFKNTGVKFLFTDIDDTLTDHGQLGPHAYSALWKLHNSGIAVIPVTGRPAGWCEMIARFWPVAGVIGENGGFYFRYINKEMKRHFCFDEGTQKKNRENLKKIESEILKAVPNARIASDQFSRLMDLAVDFAEDVEPPLEQEEIARIVQIFEKNGAVAKVSSIHVNGWFGRYDKLTMCKTFLQQEYQLDLNAIQDACAFVGDSPNDEPMFQAFQNSFAVANITAFAGSLKHLPKYVTLKTGGHGFCEIADRL